jgi:hypothetical protein
MINQKMLTIFERIDKLIKITLRLVFLSLINLEIFYFFKNEIGQLKENLKVGKKTFSKPKKSQQ